MIDKDAPAFPNVFVDMRGLTKREYFAAAALQGLLASPHHLQQRLTHSLGDEAVRQADFLIAALAEKS